jgi:hypothetical protein
MIRLCEVKKMPWQSLQFASSFEDDLIESLLVERHVIPGLFRYLLFVVSFPPLFAR